MLQSHPRGRGGGLSDPQLRVLQRGGQRAEELPRDRLCQRAGGRIRLRQTPVHRSAGRGSGRAAGVGSTRRTCRSSGPSGPSSAAWPAWLTARTAAASSFTASRSIATGGEPEKVAAAAAQSPARSACSVAAPGAAAVHITQLRAKGRPASATIYYKGPLAPGHLELRATHAHTRPGEPSGPLRRPLLPRTTTEPQHHHHHGTAVPSLAHCIRR